MADGRACAPLEDFPLLAAHAAGGPPLAYLDNAATTQKPSCVLDAMDDFYRTACGNPHRSAHALAAAATRVYEDARSTFYRTACGNPHRSAHALAAAATRVYEDARSTVARFIGASPEETAFTSGATHALNTVALCYCAERLEPGDEIALTLLEHHSNLVPWQTAARLSRARLSFIVPDRDGVVSDDEIDRAIGPRTRVVAFTGMSNVLGTVPPVKRIIEAAHACGAVTPAAPSPCSTARRASRTSPSTCTTSTSTSPRSRATSCTALWASACCTASGASSRKRRPCCEAGAWWRRCLSARPRSTEV